MKKNFQKNTTKKLRFTSPNLIIVFSNDYPEITKFLEDTWISFKINTNLELEEVAVAQVKKKMEVGYTNKYRYHVIIIVISIN